MFAHVMARAGSACRAHALPVMMGGVWAGHLPMRRAMAHALLPPIEHAHSARTRRRGAPGARSGSGALGKSSAVGTGHTPSIQKQHCIGAGVSSTSRSEGDPGPPLPWWRRLTNRRKARRERLLKESQVERATQWKGSSRTVYLAIATNASVTLAKFVASGMTGSGTMLAEGVHSMADTLNQCLLAYGISRSVRAPDKDHPYGYGPDRYVWALISGVGIFFIGSGVTLYHGVMSLLSPPLIQFTSIALGVLAVSFLLEGATFLVALKDVRSSARKAGMSVQDYIRYGSDPMSVAVLMEDGVAVAGVTVGAICITLASITGNSIYDAIGSIFVAGLLGGVATFLVQKNRDALLGRSIRPEQMKKIMNVLLNEPIISSVHDIKATTIGADSIRFKAEIQFNGRVVSERFLMQANKSEEALLHRVQSSVHTPRQMHKFMSAQGAELIEFLGEEIDRVELQIQQALPGIRTHVDLEIM